MSSPLLLSGGLAASLALIASPLSTPAFTADTAETCDDGVTVVVDFTDIGGEVEVGCATEDPGNGREALEGAGFEPTDSEPGMICAIDSQPDPCPEEFDGNYWSYWTTADGEWEAHMEGADTTAPAAGDVEGWRYNDGSVGPEISPDEAPAAAGDTGEAADTGDAEDAEDRDAQDDATTEAAADSDDDGLGSTWIWIGAAGVFVVAAVIAMLVRRSRQ